MTEDAPITRREFDLTIQNISLTIAKEVGVMMDTKISDWEKRWDATSEENYKDHVLELTGEKVENMDKIRAGSQHAIKAAESTSDTIKMIKTTAIGYSVPLGLSAFIAWFVSHAPWK